MQKSSVVRALTVAALSVALIPAAQAADFDWTKYKGTTITFLANNNAVGNAVAKHKAEFEKLTGMTVKIDTYQEQQMRQRLVTVLNARSDEVDVFMTLVSREGEQFAKAGWYADLGTLKADSSPDYDFAGLRAHPKLNAQTTGCKALDRLQYLVGMDSIIFGWPLSPALVKAATINGKLTSIPANVEGPVIYYRKDIFAKCGVAFPTALGALPDAAKAIKACDGGMTPFVSRGLRDAVAYIYSNVVHNMGGQYMKDGKSDLCSAPNKAALGLYAGLLKDYGPPGVVNYTFNQISSLYRTGRAAIAFESTNEFLAMMEGGAREGDTAIAVLPAGPGGSVPTGIGWGLSVSPFSTKQGPAWYLVQWATSPAMQAELARDGIAAPRAKVAEDPEYKAFIAAKPIRQEWQRAVDAIARTGSSEVGFPIVANPASRSPIGQSVDEVLLAAKTVDQACADADRSLDALIAGQ